MTTQPVTSEIYKAMEQENFRPPDQIHIDGQIHRFCTNGRKGDKSGYYGFWIHSNGFVCGFFGDWRTGQKKIWHNKQDQTLTDADQETVNQQIEKAKVAASEERKATNKKAIKKSQRILEKAKPATDTHPYLKAKQIKSHGMYELGNTLLVPVMGVESEIYGLQKIFPDGQKRFQLGTDKVGHFFTFKGEQDTIYLCEGYATGASIHEATGQIVICAFDAGNLMHVAKAIHMKYPGGKFIVAGDDDRWTNGNPGRRKAEAAAKAINGTCIFPIFKSLEGKPTDFNDLACREGIGKLREQLHEVLINMLSTMGPIEYDKCRKTVARSLGIRVRVLDREMEARRTREIGKNESIIEDLEPWHAFVEGGHILNEIEFILKRHVILDENSLVACVLWVVLTYVYNAFRILPILGITSPEKRCGKTTLLELLQGLTKSALLASNITPSALFRVIDKYQPCLLIDEADTFIKDNDELRGIINSGHTRKSAFVIRTNSETMEPERFSTWSPKAIAMIGDQSDTNKDRSIPIRLKRKLPNESVRRISLNFDDEQILLRRKCERWGQDNLDHLKSVTPDIPNVGNDRAADNWSPLILIAEISGGQWPERAHRAYMALEMMDDKKTIRQRLLADIKAIFEKQESDRISSKILVEELVKIEDHPWGEWRRGKPITQNGLARLLKPFGIRSKVIRQEMKTPRGYEIQQFDDAFKRYISAFIASTSPIQSATPQQASDNGKLYDCKSTTQKNDVALSNSRRPKSSEDCGSVALQKGNIGEGIIETGSKSQQSELFPEEPQGDVDETLL